MRHLGGTEPVRTLVPMIVGASLVACGSSPPAPTDERLHSTLWVQTSAEYAVAAMQVFALARRQVDAAIQDPTWNALDCDPDPAPDLPLAVITDIDETVLDNSAFAARNILADRQFTAEVWDLWVEEAAAEPVPGAAAYLSWLAVERGVEVFYVTRRDAHHEAATRRNLRKLGFPLAEGTDTVLMTGEIESWGPDKAARRALICKRYRVIQLFGDNLSDFMDLPQGVSPEERVRRAREASSLWGTRWFMLPNPIYGDWETAIMDGLDPAAEEAEVLRRKMGGLEPL